MKMLLKTFTALSFIFSASTAFSEVKEYSITIKDHKFEPAVIEVPANQEFKLIVENLDKTAEEFESHDLKKEKMIGGGKKATIAINGLKAGEYKFVGEFNEKTAQGKIIVK